MTARQLSDVDEIAVCGSCGTTLAESGTTCSRCVSRSAKALADEYDRRGRSGVDGGDRR
jgi:hypothetical protein